MDVQVVNDLHQFLDRLEKEKPRLEIDASNDDSTRPQIRLIQNTNQTLAEKNSVFNYDNDSFMEESNCHWGWHCFVKRCRHSATPSVWNDEPIDSKELWNVEDFYDWNGSWKTNVESSILKLFKRLNKTWLETLEETILIRTRRPSKT